MSDGDGDPVHRTPPPAPFSLPPVLSTHQLPLSEFDKDIEEFNSTAEPGEEMTADLTKASSDRSINTQRPSTRTHSLWVCQMIDGKQASSHPSLTTSQLSAAATAAAAAAASGKSRVDNPLAIRDPSLRSDVNVSDTEDDVISSHAGSFYNSLRMEQKTHTFNQTRRYVGIHGGPPYVDVSMASPTSNQAGYSELGSTGSYEADIISFDFSLSPTTTTATTTSTNHAFSSSAAPTPLSPFSPIAPNYPSQQLSQQPSRPSRPPPPPPTRAVGKRERSLPAVSAQNTLQQQQAMMMMKDSSTSRKTSISASSSCPRTPGQFMAWQRELKEARLSRSCEDDGRSLSAELTAPTPKTNSSQQTPRSASGVGCTPFGATPPSHVPPPHHHAPGTGDLHLRLPETTAAMTDAATTAARSCHRSSLPSSRPTYTNVKDNFSKSAAGPFYRVHDSGHPLQRQDPQVQNSSNNSSCSQFPPLSKASSHIHSSMASSGTTSRDYGSSDSSSGVLRLGGSPQQRRRRRRGLEEEGAFFFSPREQVAMGLLLVVALIYILNQFFYINIFLYITWLMKSLQ